MTLRKLSGILILAAISFSASAENSVNNVKTLAIQKLADKPALEAGKPVAKKPLQPATTLVEATPIRVLLIPEKETTISSTIAARLVSFNGTLGQRFKAGDLLVAFDCEEALARVEMSQAELSGAIDQHEAKVKMQGLDQASDVEVALAASASNKAKAQLNLNKAQVAQCRIYAPWAGRVAKANVKNHMSVTPGQPLMELVKDGPLKLKLNLPSKLLAQVKTGSKFNILIDETGLRYPASVSAVNSRVDPVSQTVELEAKLLKSHSELLAGMSGVADFSANAQVSN
ncbi:MAG: efflux RND transporter periplasmic adaptor subunit [Pseudomonadota bacterium]